MLSTDIKTLANLIDGLTVDCPQVVINRQWCVHITEALNSLATKADAMERGKPLGDIPPLRVVAGTTYNANTELGTVVSFPESTKGGQA